MPFPDSPRVIYNKNPLAEVICQITFPAILRIDSETPFKYQERLREEYPRYSEQQAANLKLSLPPELQPAGNALSFRPGRAGYNFVSADTLWKVSLTRESLSISTRAYKYWGNFIEHFSNPLNSFIEEYKPAFISRIGLRYIDVIDRSKLGLQGCEWSELLKPQIAGELSSPDIAHEIVSCVNQLTIKLDDEGGTILLNHGLVDNNSNQPANFAYLIDCDFSTERTTEAKDVIERLNYFNKYSGRLFRWCITERLHDALEPEPIQ